MIEKKENEHNLQNIIETAQVYDLSALSKQEIKEESQKDTLLKAVIEQRILSLKEFTLFDMQIKFKVRQNGDTYIIIEDSERNQRRVHQALAHDNDIFKYTRRLLLGSEMLEKKEIQKGNVERYIKSLYKIEGVNSWFYKTSEEKGKFVIKVRMREGHFHKMVFEKNLQTPDSYFLFVTLVNENNRSLTIAGKKIEFRTISELETYLPFTRNDLINESNKIIEKKNEAFRKKQQELKGITITKETTTEQSVEEVKSTPQKLSKETEPSELKEFDYDEHIKKRFQQLREMREEGTHTKDIAEEIEPLGQGFDDELLKPEFMRNPKPIENRKDAPKQIRDLEHLDEIVEHTHRLSIVVIRRSTEKNVMFYRNSEDEEFKIKMSPYEYERFQEANEYYNCDSYQVKKSIWRMLAKRK